METSERVELSCLSTLLLLSCVCSIAMRVGRGGLKRALQLLSRRS